MSKKALVPVSVLSSPTAPAGRYAGELYYNSTNASLFVYTGTAWNAVGGGYIDGGQP